MYFGIHSLLFKETFVAADLPVLDRCRRMGFDAVAIIPFDPEGFPAAKVKQAADDLGLVINTGYGMPPECNTNVKVHADTFHLLREENDMVAALERCGPQLGYLHACENQRGIPGTGMVPWPEIFRALKRIAYNGCITIESFDPDMPKIAKLCCIWHKFADSPEALATEGLAYLQRVYQET